MILRFTILTLFLSSLTFAFTGKDVDIKEYTNSIKVKTPCGTKDIILDPSVDINRYKVDIPMEMLCDKKDDAEDDADDEEERAPATQTVVIQDTKAPEPVKPKPAEDVIDEDDEDDEEEVAEVLPVIDKRADYVATANHFYLNGKLYEAAKICAALTAEYPDYLRGWKMYGSVLYKLGDLDNAKETWKKGLALNPEDAEMKSIIQTYINK